MSKLSNKLKVSRKKEKKTTLVKSDLFMDVFNNLSTEGPTRVQT